MLRDLHIDPDQMSEVELYDMGWELIVNSIPDTPEGQKIVTRMLEHFDLDEEAQRHESLKRDLNILGIGSIENLRAMAEAQGKTLVFKGIDDKESVVR